MTTTRRRLRTFAARTTAIAWCASDAHGEYESITCSGGSGSSSQVRAGVPHTVLLGNLNPHSGAALASGPLEHLHQWGTAPTLWRGDGETAGANQALAATLGGHTAMATI